MKRTSLLPRPRVIVLGSLALLMAGTVFATLGPNPWATLGRIPHVFRGAPEIDHSSGCGGHGRVIDVFEQFGTDPNP